MVVPSSWKVLIPVRVLEGESLSDDLTRVLTSVETTVLGYYVTPDQTPPGQARLQFEDRAQSALDDLVSLIISFGGTVEARLVFTPEKTATVDRIAPDTDCNVILFPKPVSTINSVLVALRGHIGEEAMAGFVATLLADRNIDITLYHVAEKDDEIEQGQALLETARTHLINAGINPTLIHQEVAVDPSPFDAILQESTNHESVILGESHASWRTLVFGDLSERISEQADAPVFIVRPEVPATIE